MSVNITRRLSLNKPAIAAIAAGLAIATAVAVALAGPGQGTPTPPPVPLATLPESTLARVGIRLDAPSALDQQAATVDEAAARQVAHDRWPAYTFIDAGLGRWRNVGRDLGGAIQDGRLVWLVVSESPDGYYVHGESNAPASVDAHIDVIDALTAEWLGGADFPR